MMKSTLIACVLLVAMASADRGSVATVRRDVLAPTDGLKIKKSVEDDVGLFIPPTKTLPEDTVAKKAYNPDEIIAVQKTATGEKIPVYAEKRKIPFDPSQEVRSPPAPSKGKEVPSSPSKEVPSSPSKGDSDWISRVLSAKDKASKNEQRGTRGKKKYDWSEFMDVAKDAAKRKELFEIPFQQGETEYELDVDSAPLEPSFATKVKAAKFSKVAMRKAKTKTFYTKEMFKALSDDEICAQADITSVFGEAQEVLMDEFDNIALACDGGAPVAVSLYTDVELGEYVGVCVQDDFDFDYVLSEGDSFSCNTKAGSSVEFNIASLAVAASCKSDDDCGACADCNVGECVDNFSKVGCVTIPEFDSPGGVKLVTCEYNGLTYVKGDNFAQDGCAYNNCLCDEVDGNGVLSCSFCTTTNSSPTCEEADRPLVTGISPSSGSVGTVVTLTGSFVNAVGAAEVRVTTWVDGVSNGNNVLADSFDTSTVTFTVPDRGQTSSSVLSFGVIVYPAGWVTGVNPNLYCWSNAGKTHASAIADLAYPFQFFTPTDDDGSDHGDCTAWQFYRDASSTRFAKCVGQCFEYDSTDHKWVATTWSALQTWTSVGYNTASDLRSGGDGFNLLSDEACYHLGAVSWCFPWCCNCS